MKAARRTRWNAGDAVLFRSILDTGRIGAVVPMTVVGDEDELVALYLAPGTVCKRRAGRRGGPRGRQMVEDSGLHEDWTWRENRRLFLWQPNAGHAVSLFWRDADDTFLGWYVDVLRPMRRTPLGFDTRDLILDVVVNPDRSWQLKDEDELTWAEEHGTVRPDEADHIRAEAMRAAALLEAGDPIFDERWIGWKPPPAWLLPRLPLGWDIPPGELPPPEASGQDDIETDERQPLDPG